MNYSDFYKGRSTFIESIKNKLESSGLINMNNFIINFYKEFEFFDKLIIIGDDYGTNICINLDTYEMLSVDRNREYPIRFINSEFSSFIKFVDIYLQEQDCYINANQDELISVVNKIKESFGEIDYKAISDEENWWPVVLEQMEHELI